MPCIYIYILYILKIYMEWLWIYCLFFFLQISGSNKMHIGVLTYGSIVQNGWPLLVEIFHGSSFFHWSSIYMVRSILLFYCSVSAWLHIQVDNTLMFKLTRHRIPRLNDCEMTKFYRMVLHCIVFRDWFWMKPNLFIVLRYNCLVLGRIFPFDCFVYE